MKNISSNFHPAQGPGEQNREPQQEGGGPHIHQLLRRHLATTLFTCTPRLPPSAPFRSCVPSASWSTKNRLLGRPRANPAPPSHVRPLDPRTEHPYRAFGAWAAALTGIPDSRDSLMSQTLQLIRQRAITSGARAARTINATSPLVMMASAGRPPPRLPLPCQALPTCLPSRGAGMKP